VNNYTEINLTMICLMLMLHVNNTASTDMEALLSYSTHTHW